MTHHLDPWRAAKLLIDQYGGAEAEHMAENRLFALSEAGDKAGADAWVVVVKAIQELRRTAPREGEARH